MPLLGMVLGMVLGNSLTGISLRLDTLLHALAEERDKVELELALGATRWEAARAPLYRRLTRGTSYGPSSSESAPAERSERVRRISTQIFEWRLLRGRGRWRSRRRRGSRS